jgi:hypothetical protein
MGTKMIETRGSAVVTFLATALGVGAIVFFQRQAIVPELRAQRQLLERLAEETEQIRFATKLLHFDRPPGPTFDNIMAHLRFWTDKSGTMGGSAVDRPHIEARLQDGLDAIQGLGPPAYAQVEAAFLAADGAEEDQLRKLLLKALAKIDPEQAAPFIENVLRRRLPAAISSGLRVIAADELLAIDAPRAGEALKDVLLTENVRGQVRDYASGAVDYANPGFFNFVGRFLASPYPQKEDVLLQMLSNTLHDVPTLQEVMDGLAKLKSRGAEDRLKEILENRSHPAYSTPLFRGRAVRTLAAVLGAEACGYFREQLALEKDAKVRQILGDMIKETCG